MSRSPGCRLCSLMNRQSTNATKFTEEYVRCIHIMCSQYRIFTAAPILDIPPPAFLECTLLDLGLLALARRPLRRVPLVC